MSVIAMRVLDKVIMGAQSIVFGISQVAIVSF